MRIEWQNCCIDGYDFATPVSWRHYLIKNCTGGALGIGAEVVRLCHAAGAHVFFGDVLVDAGEALARELSSDSKPHVVFVPTDVSDYQSNLRLFDTAYEKCGRVDHAASVAGVGERGNIVDSGLTLESVRQEPKESMTVLGVNFVGPIYFSRIASVYLRQPGLDDKSSTSTADKSLTLVSSVAGFTEAPGLYVYSATKHGVYGLMRALRKSETPECRWRSQVLTRRPGYSSSPLDMQSEPMRSVHGE